MVCLQSERSQRATLFLFPKEISDSNLLSKVIRVKTTENFFHSLD